MASPEYVTTYWNLRLEECRTALEANNFEAHVCATSEGAVTLVAENLLPKLQPKSLAWGGSATFTGIGLYQRLTTDERYKELEILDTYDKSLSPEQSYERRRQALLTDCFFTGTNAVTEAGQLVNLDMIGNRVGATIFGPRNVIVLAGRNKVVGDLEAAMIRIKEFVAPTNAMRLNKKTPCAKTGRCMDCSSPDRICNLWTISEKSFPKGRVIVILINEDLGL